MSLSNYHSLWESAAQGGAEGACPQRPKIGVVRTERRWSPEHSDPGYCEAKAGIPPKKIKKDCL
jgi:hypothetical protein